MTSFRDSIRHSNAGAYLLYLLTFVIFIGVGSIALRLLGIHLGTIAAEIVAILGAAVLWRRVVGDAAADWPSSAWRIRPAPLVCLVAAAIALGLLANSLATLMVELSPAMKQMAQSYSERIGRLLLDATGLQRVLGIVGVCVAAPICEEALFRGTILVEQRKREAIWVAVIVNGLLFSAFHLDPVAAMGLALIGMFLAHLTIRSGRLAPAVLAHAVVNTSNAVVLPAFVADAGQADAPVDLPELLVLIAALTILAAIFWRLSVRLLEPPVEEASAG